jgi:riboflavin kinase/FMN adenylyltransferase
MQYWQVKSLDDRPNIPHGSVLCLGFFDGFHRGHQALLNHAKTFIKPVVMISFDRNPKWNRSEFVLTPPALRKQLFEDFSVDGFIELQFNDAIRLAPPEVFLAFLTSLKPSAVISGYDYKFGYRASGDVRLLKSQNNFQVITLDDVKDGEDKISSSRIFSYLEQGNIVNANRLLGRPYAIQGHVGHGFKKGRTIGFPTANIILSESFYLPKTGVYLTEVIVEGKVYSSMANLGFHPTLNALTQKTLEVHLFDFNQSIYDQTVEVRFLDYLRDEQKFASLDALKQQLHHDAQNAKERYRKFMRI